MRGASLEYAIREVDDSALRFQVVHVPTGQVAYRSRRSADADDELERLRELANRPPMTDAELDELMSGSMTAGEW